MNIQPANQPYFPEPEKAAEGLAFRSSQLDHMIRVMKDASGSGSRISKIFNKLGIGLEARVIRTLQKEKKEIATMLRALGRKEPSPTTLPTTFPDTAEEIKEVLVQKKTDKKAIATAIAEVKTQIVGLKRVYHDAVVLQSIEEAGLAKIGAGNAKEVIDTMDKLKAHLVGLKHELVHVECDIQQLENKELMTIEEPKRRYYQAVARIVERLTQRLDAIQDKIQKKSEQLKGAPFLMRASLKKELRALRKQAATIAGRKLLLSEMKSQPDQMIKDVNRLGEVRVGNEVVDLKGKSQDDIVDILSKEIRAYVKKQKKAIEVDDATMAEVLYAVSQTFFAPVAIYAAFDPAISLENGWGAPANATTRNSVFSMKSDTLLSIKSQVHKRYEYSGEDEQLRGQTKDLVMEFECNYDLQTKQVTYNYHYILDGKTSSWSNLAHVELDKTLPNF